MTSTQSVDSLLRLAARVQQKRALQEREIDDIERATELFVCPHSIDSSIIYAATQLWRTIDSLDETFLSVASSLLQRNQTTNARSLVLCSLSRKIRIEWSTYEEEYKQKLLKLALFQLQKEESIGGEVLHRVNEVLVSIFKFQWNGIFSDFINYFLEGNNMSNHKIANNFAILRQIMREGFNFHDVDLTSQERKNFQQIIHQDFKKMIQIATRTLFYYESYTNFVTASCLKMLSEAVSQFPVLGLYKSNLIEALINLLGKNWDELVLQCLVQMFQYREDGLAIASFSFIAKKQLSIFKAAFANSKKDYNDRSMKFSQSTNQSGSPKSRKETDLPPFVSSLKVRMLMQLLTLFLQRFAPFMGDQPSINSSFYIERDSTTKLVYQLDLYEQMKQLYWEFITFFNTYLLCFNGGSLYEVYDLSEELNVLENFQYLFILYNKLNLSIKQEIVELFNFLIFKMTPIEAGFQRYFLGVLYGMNKNDYRTFDDEYCSMYANILKEAMKISDMRQLYADIIHKNIKELTDISKEKEDDLEDIAQRVEDLNRICWSMVESTSICSQISNYLPLSNYVTILQEATQLIQNYDMKKCLALNTKYLMIASCTLYQHTVHHSLLYHNLSSTQRNYIAQFIIKILAKVYLHPEFQIDDTQIGSINILIEKISQIEVNKSHQTSFIQIYEALYSFIVKINHSAIFSIFLSLRQKLLRKDMKFVNDLYKESTGTFSIFLIDKASYISKKICSISEFLLRCYELQKEQCIYFNQLVDSHLEMLEESIVTLTKTFLSSSKYGNYGSVDEEDILQIQTFSSQFFALCIDYVKIISVKVEEQKKVPKGLLSHIHKKRAIVWKDFIERCFDTLKTFSEQHEDGPALEYFEFTASAFKYYQLIELSEVEVSHLINEPVLEILNLMRQKVKNQRLVVQQVQLWSRIIDYVNYFSNEALESLLSIIQVHPIEGYQLSLSCNEMRLDLLESISEKFIFSAKNTENRSFLFWMKFVQVLTQTILLSFQFAGQSNLFEKCAKSLFILSQSIFLEFESITNYSSSLMITLYDRLMKEIRLPLEKYYPKDPLLAEQLNELFLEIFGVRKMGIFFEKIRDCVIFSQRCKANEKPNNQSF